MKVITDDQDKRKEFKERTLQRVSEVLEQEPENNEPSLTIEVEVPSNFWELSDTQLYGLLKHQKLTPEQANQVVEQLRGIVPGSREFKVLLKLPVIKEEEPQGVEEESVPKLSVTLPEEFRSFKTKDQYLYLTKERALSPEQANDIVDILGGKAPFSNTEYKIGFED